MHRVNLIAIALLGVLMLLGISGVIDALAPTRTASAAPAAPSWTVQYQAPEGITLRGL